MTWRQRIAHAKFVLERGRYLLLWLYHLGVGAGAARLLLPEWVPTWAILAGIPPAIALCWLAGYCDIRWGLVREDAAAAAVASVARPEVIHLEWFARLLEAHRIPLNNIPANLRPEIVQLLGER